MAESIAGLHAIEEILKSGSVSGELVVARGGRRIDGLVELARRRGVEIRRVSAEEMDRRYPAVRHQGAVLERAASEQRGALRSGGSKLSDLIDGTRGTHALALLLDGITDPHNLGAILRSADQFRVDFAVLPSRRSAHETSVVRRISSGASIWVPQAVVANLASAIERLKEAGFWIYGADMEGKAAHRVDLRGRVALVMGSEGEGLGRLVRERCDELIRIPASGRVDSFNVSVAAGILLYEVRRQQGYFEPGGDESEKPTAESG